MEKELSCEVFDKILGIGSYGKVCEAKVGQLPCAAKLLHDTMFQLGRDDPGLRKFVQRFEQECEFLKQIKHPNIVQFLGTVRDPRSQRLTLLMELMDESLTRFLERSTGPLPYHTQLNICHDVALALAYLHSNDIIHRDLSSNNVLLIGEGSRAKVTDFGMYKLVGTNPAMTPLTTCPGTSAYMPPEALVTPPQYSDKLDCFSHGVLTIQVTTRQFPNPGDAHVMEASRRSFRIIPESERRKKQLDTVEPNHPLLPLALHCIEDIDKERPSADEICGRLALLRQESRFTESMEQFSMRSLQVSSQQLRESVRRLQQELEEKDKIIARKNEELMKTLANTETLLEDAIAESRRELATKDSIIEQFMAENRSLLAAKELSKIEIKKVQDIGVKSKVEDTVLELRAELHKADIRWTRFAQRKKVIYDEEAIRTEELYRKFQGILNKLTPQKFQALAEQALKLEITTEERLSGCIDMMFKKAINEEMYSIAYANLCKVMTPIKVDVIVEEGKIKCTNFRRMLLTKCQHEFEKDKQDDATLEEMHDKSTKAESEKERQELKEELSFATSRMRKRSLGNIRFIGELFKLSMLSEIVMHECITRLLKSTSDEESLECFGILIMTTGKDLDRPEAKPRMDKYFRCIDKIIKMGKIPARIKFILKDVQDLRTNKWVPRLRPMMPCSPQLHTIDQEQADTTVNPPSQRPRAPKSRSHAIKLVDPNTKTEVKVGEPSEPPNSKETVAEFKNKVQSAVSSTGPLAGTTPEVGEGAQSQHRPNAIITNPDQSPEKVEEVAVPACVDVELDFGKETVDLAESKPIDAGAEQIVESAESSCSTSSDSMSEGDGSNSSGSSSKYTLWRGSSYQPPQPVQPHGHYQPRGSRKSFHHRAATGTDLMQHPPTFNPKMALGGGIPHAQTRVLLANQQQQQVQASQLAYNPQAMSMRPGIFPSPQPNPAVLPYFGLAAQQQQPQQQLMYQPGPTQQPIGLGQPATHMPVNVMQQPMPMTNIRGITQTTPPVMYNTQEQADTTVNPPSQRLRAPKSRSIAIKIVDPNTKTEVKVGEPSEQPTA